MFDKWEADMLAAYQARTCFADSTSDSVALSRPKSMLTLWVLSLYDQRSS